MIVMGRIVAPYGIYGWLKVEPMTEHFDGLFDYPEWWLGREDGPKKSPWQIHTLEQGKVHSDHLLVKLVGINDRDMAMACKGKHIAVPREQLPEPGDDEYYWSDLTGLRVTNLQGIELGTIDHLFETGANDVMVVKGERERLIPFIDQVVLQVDIANKHMQVDWDAEF